MNEIPPEWGDPGDDWLRNPISNDPPFIPPELEPVFRRLADYFAISRRLLMAYNSRDAHAIEHMVQSIDRDNAWRDVALSLVGDLLSLANDLFKDKGEAWIAWRVQQQLDRIAEINGD
ncbi:hypothetical protein [Mycobacteroides abscessus]|uniref:hypothetical protein n=1 Tax=Mycobacteroides abscessus TaxID=36809 RepID=UPI0019274110|nr:hypothetical protein [Mycobacteroides abscessus]MBL3753032.1 hypothetical protein [Mycobacteroides abscessus subsp. massiliense]